MNILQILPELNVGGVETGTLDLAHYLVRAGHKAVVVSNGGRLVQDLEAGGAKHYALPVHKKSLLTVVKMMRPLIDIIEKEQIDIVHARSRVPAWIAYLACRRTKAVFITTCHGYYSKHPFSFVMGWARRVIVLSNVIGRHMIEDFGVPHERIVLIPRSVDLVKFPFIAPLDRRNKEFNIGIIGRITPIKGHLYFIKAMAKVAKVIPHIKIWVVGDAPASKELYKEQVQILTKRLGLWNATEFVGVRKDIPGILADLHVLVLATTSHEAFGRVIIEAQARGVPVVATRVGGVVDIIEDGRNGLLVPPADPQAMAEAVLRLYHDPALRTSLATHALAKVKEEYSIEVMAERTLAVYKEAISCTKILIIKLGSLGDVILSTAALRQIRRKFSVGYSISLLVGAEAKDIVLRCPYVDEVIVYDYKHTDAGWRGFLKVVQSLRKKDFDIVVDLQNNRLSHMASFLSGARHRYGYDNKKLGFLLNHRLQDKKLAIPCVEHQFQMLSLLGIPQDDLSLEMWPSQDDERFAHEFIDSLWLSQRQKIVGINIAASERWATKNWPLRNMIQLCQELSQRDMRIIITGMPNNSAQASRIIEAARDSKIINACGKTTINQLACLIKRCAVYVSCDSAALHVAAAVGTPCVALFGPTDSRRHVPPARACVILQKTLPCSPCYRSTCKHTTCMTQITPEEVLAAIDKLIK
ncbi:MAG: lipopolysaccharide heptosyltransferase II [Candidatus Omnitrophica bacterium]|nr:lipopolysaccharide heptosyltransferase II [Candidatus Omnitrophota bacterium]